MANKRTRLGMLVLAVKAAGQTARVFVTRLCGVHNFYLEDYRMKKMAFCAVPLLMAIMGCGSAPAPVPIPPAPPAPVQAAPAPKAETKDNALGMELDAAIKAAAVKMGTSLPARTEVALVSIASSSVQFSEYVISRLEAALVDDGKLVVLDRANLDKVREEQGFNLSGEVDDNSAKAIGKLLGAGAIVTGSFVNLGDVYGLSLKAINMTTAAIAASYPADISKSTRIETLLASGGGMGTTQTPRPSGSTATAPASSSAGLNVSGTVTVPSVTAPSAGLSVTGAVQAPAQTAAVQPAPAPAAPGSTATASPAAPSGGAATFTTIEQISAYLATVTGRASSPAPLKAAIPLGAMTNAGSGWHNLLAALNDARKFVALDLSACTMDGKIFDPRVGINAEDLNAGASFIVEIILPNAATSTAASTSENNITFRYFTNLRKAEGNVTDIGAYTFTGKTRLTTVSFPKAINIGRSAFYNCGGLTTVSFPSAMSIGQWAFFLCGGLTAISFPEVMSIGENAFQSCSGLTTATFPEADSIGSEAFASCSKLTSVTLGTITPPNFSGYRSAFPGNLRDAYFQQPEGQRAGRYMRSEGGSNWSKR
ncbi:leucine-rich repeat domain-containing protein [Breznakiellaceae bacterium SP9]